MPPQVRKRLRASKVSRPSRNVPEEINLSQVPHTPISEWILHPDAEKTLRVLRDKYGESVSILPVDAEELFCVCLDVEGKYVGGMVECTNASKCLAQWFHLRCIGMTVPPKEDDDWFCTRCIQRRIGRACDWFDRLLCTSKGHLQNTILGQPSSTSARLSNAMSNNPFVHRCESTTRRIISYQTIPAAADLATAICRPRGNPCPAPNGFPDCEDDLVMCDAADSPGDTTLSEETEVLEGSRLVQQMAYVHRPGMRTDRTPVVRRETSSTKQHTRMGVRDTDDVMDSAEPVSATDYGNEHSMYTDPSELYEDISDGYLGEESDVSMSGDS